jgi:NADPH:quinone reductase-like Zn-dependent oxidoreductase
MQAIIIDEGPPFQNLRIVDRPTPTPARGEVVMKLKAASLNFRDLEMVNGTYSSRFPLPLVPLSDGVGEVVAVGDGVTRVRKGDRVAGTFWQGWVAGAFEDCPQLGGSTDGMLSEYVKLDEGGVVHVPPHLTDQEAATLPCAAVTAWQALVTDGLLKSGETVLIQGTGGVAVFALQFAVMFGARSIVISSSDAKLERAKALGASSTVNYVKTRDWHLAARELDGGRGVDHVIEVGGAETLLRSLESIRLGGQIRLIGYVGGKQGVVNPMAILNRRAVLRGLPTGSRATFEAMNCAVAENRMRPMVDRVFPWRDFADALRYLGEGKHFGKIVLSF